MKVVNPNIDTASLATQLLEKLAQSRAKGYITPLPQNSSGLQAEAYMLRQLQELLITTYDHAGLEPAYKCIELQSANVRCFVSVVEDSDTLAATLSDELQQATDAGADPTVYTDSYIADGRSWQEEAAVALQLILPSDWRKNQEMLQEDLTIVLDHEFQHLRQSKQPTNPQLDELSYRKQAHEIDADAFAISRHIHRTDGNFASSTLRVLQVLTRSTKVAEQLTRDKPYMEELGKRIMSVPIDKGLSF